MSQSELKVGGLYVILLAKEEPPEPNDFHWGLYLRSDAMGGVAYHIKDRGDGYQPEHGYTSGILSSRLLVGLFRVADISLPWHPTVDRVIRTYDSSLNYPGRSTSCKFWVLNILTLLIQPTDTGYQIVNCQNLPILEQEIRDWGNRMSQRKMFQHEPRPVDSSKICGLPEYRLCV
ncbi:unnamed protein product [Penicillium olsonii]|nr:unnamed protein product [Penicillium olsonii]